VGCRKECGGRREGRTVCCESSFGVLVCEEADVGELPTEDVDEEDDRLCSGGGFIFGLGHVG
jgi:hypothetical protein